MKAELNGCLNKDGMGKGTDPNQINKNQMHNVYFSTFSLTSCSISYQRESKRLDNRLTPLKNVSYLKI